MQSPEEVAFEAVQCRNDGHHGFCRQYLLDLEATVGRSAASRLIEKAERQLGFTASAASAAEIVTV